MKRGRDKIIIQQVEEAVARWPTFAKEAGVMEKQQTQIAKAHRLPIPAG
jgi:serine/threonine-protein kinase HipA